MLHVFSYSIISSYPVIRCLPQNLNEKLSEAPPGYLCRRKDGLPIFLVA
jgi:hypothetical protein